MGGGLASKASLSSFQKYVNYETEIVNPNITIIPAVTFNAAGITVEDNNYNTIAKTYIKAYYVDYDLVTMLQYIPFLPKAFGVPIELDGYVDSYIAELGGISAFIAYLSEGSFNICYELAGFLTDLDISYLMYTCHGFNSLYYGFLVSENYLGVIVTDMYGYQVSL